MIPPSEEELIDVKEAIDRQIDQMAAELEVQLLEKQKSLMQALQSGEIIRERYELEMQKAQQMMAQSIKEQRSVLYARARDEASQTEVKVVSEEEYKLLKSNQDIAETIVNEIPFFERKIKKSCAAGDVFLYEKILNIRHSPLIAMPYMFTGTPYPMSAVVPLVGKQREINKAHQIMIHNANLSSNLRWLYVEGEIPEEEWENYSGAPGALLKYRQGYSASGPREIMPQNINNAFFTVEQDSKSDLEYLAGIQPPTMGISNANDETYRGFLAKDEYGTRRIRSWVGNVVEPVLEHVGRVFQQLAVDHYTIEKVFRIVQPNPGGSFEVKQTEINVPLYDDRGNEIARFNDYGSGRYDIRLLAGSTLPINRWAVTAENERRIELGVIDDIAFIQQSDIPNKEALIERKSMLSQAQSQIRSYEDEIKQLNGDIETLRRQLLQMGLRDELNTASKEVDRSKTETKMIDKLVQERMRDALKEARAAMKMEIEKAKEEAKKAMSDAKKQKNEK